MLSGPINPERVSCIAALVWLASLAGTAILGSAEVQLGADHTQRFTARARYAIVRQNPASRFALRVVVMVALFV